MFISLARWLGGKGHAKKSRTPVRRLRLGLECLEARDLPSISPLVCGPNDSIIPALSGSPDQALVGNVSHGTGAADAKAPATPTLTAVAVSSSQINLTWNKDSGATGYVVNELINDAWETIANLGKSSTSDQVKGLTAGTTYSFELGASDAAGKSWSPVKTATTQGGSTTISEPTASAPYEPVSGTLFGPNGPSYLDVEQGDLGDCWLLSSLAEVAARDPSAITSMFTADGTTVENGVTVSLYTVRFYDNGVAKSVTVDTELPGGGNYYDHPANGVLWVALAEKAYAEANGAGYVTTSDPHSDSYNALNEGDPTWALSAITGNSAADFAINPTNIASAWNSGELVCLCTSTPSSSYIVPDHCYAVVGYNASSSTPFQVYNPWGTNSEGWALGTYNGKEVYGLFWQSATFISQNFTTQSIGTGTALDGTGGQPNSAAYVQTSATSPVTTTQSAPIALAINWTVAAPASQAATGDTGQGTSAQWPA